MRHRRRRGRETTAAIVVVAVALAATAGIIAAIAANQGGSGSSGAASSTTSSTLSTAQLRQRDAASSWSAQANAAFGGSDLATEVATMVNGQADFKAGKLSANDFAGRLATVSSSFVTARDKVSGLPPFPLSALVKPLYVRAGQLYVEAVRLLQQGVILPPGPLADQTALAAARVRELGDRVFDRGRVVVDGFLREPTSPDVEVRLPAEVPEWGPEGLAAGPPLEAVPPPSRAPVPPTRQATRPTEAAGRWLNAVRSVPTPGAPAVAAAIAASDPTPLRDLADRLQEVVGHLSTEPDPTGQGGREQSARLRLALLLREEAARVAQLAALATNQAVAPQLQLTARRLLLISDGVVPADLRVPASGLDPSLLTGP
jgi:hypothetical protein